MNLNRVTSGQDVPHDINVIIEIPSHSDPVDVLVVTPVPLISGSVIRCRPIGMLKMTDEAGPDSQLLAVPVDKLCTLDHQLQKAEDMTPLLVTQIAHFFEHYRDFEPNKWVDGHTAKAEILAGVSRYTNAKEKPYF